MPPPVGGLRGDTLDNNAAAIAAAHTPAVPRATPQAGLLRILTLRRHAPAARRSSPFLSPPVITQRLIQPSGIVS